MKTKSMVVALALTAGLMFGVGSAYADPQASVPAPAIATPAVAPAAAPVVAAPAKDTATVAPAPAAPC